MFELSHIVERTKERIECWLMHRDLVSLAERNNFKTVRPENVQRALHRLVTFYQKHGSDSQITAKYRTILFRIWELAENEARRTENGRFKWSRVMATCNGLYGIKESYSTRTSGAWFPQEAVGQF